VLGLVAVAVFVPATAARAEPTADQIERQITTQSNALEKIVEQYNKVNEELKASQAAADKVRLELIPLSTSLNSASDAVAQIASLSYKGAGIASMSMIFADGDPRDVVDRLTTLDQLTKHEHEQMVRFTGLKSQHDAEVAMLDALIKDQTAKRQSLDDQKKKITTDLTKLYELRRQAYGSRTTTATTSTATPPSVSGKAGLAVRFAYAQLGKPYEWAADGPGSYDCSGLTLAAWKAAGVSLPHNAEMQ